MKSIRFAHKLNEARNWLLLNGLMQCIVTGDMCVFDMKAREREKNNFQSVYDETEQFLKVYCTQLLS